MTNPNTSPFPEKEIDVSINFCCWLTLVPCTFGVVPYKTVLHLDPEEVTKTDVTLCGTNVSKRPYGELGNVDRGNCCCCVNATSAFGEISPGCGCEREKVDEVVFELKQRMKQRGDTGQIRRAEQMLDRMDLVEAKLDAIMAHLNIPQPMKMDRKDEANMS